MNVNVNQYVYTVKKSPTWPISWRVHMRVDARSACIVMQMNWSAEGWLQSQMDARMAQQ